MIRSLFLIPALVSAVALMLPGTVALGDQGHQHGPPAAGQVQPGENQTATTGTLSNALPADSTPPPAPVEKIDPGVTEHHEPPRIPGQSADSEDTHTHAEPGEAPKMPRPAESTESQRRDHAGHDHAGHSAGHPLGRIGSLGKLHPVAVHFPIAMLLGAALAVLLGLVRRNEALSNAIRFCLWIGAAGALVSVPLGWLAAAGSEHPGLEHIVEYHRWFGTGTAALSLMTLAVYETAIKRQSLVAKRWAHIMILLCALIVAIAGHFGATLIYGLNYYQF